MNKSLKNKLLSKYRIHSLKIGIQEVIKYCNKNRKIII